MRITDIGHACPVPKLPELGELSKLTAYWTCSTCNSQWFLYRWKKDGQVHVYDQVTRSRGESKAWRKAELARLQAQLANL